MAVNQIRVNRIQELQWLIPVQALERVGNLSLSGLQTIDGYTLVDGDRIIVVAQTTATEDGVYVVHSGAWERSYDCPVGRDVHGSEFYVENGTSNGQSTFVFNVNPAVIGTNDLVVEPQGGSAASNARNGLNVNAGFVELGGTLISDVLIDGDTSNSIFEVRTKGTGHSQLGWRNTGSGVQSNTNFMASPTSFSMTAYNATTSEQVQILGSMNSGLYVNDSVNDRGFVNSGDYEANFTDRTLVTKQYVDNLIGGRSWKDPVTVCIDGTNVTGNIDLSTDLVGQTVDGVVLVDGDRIGLFDQTTGSESGIYDVVAGAGNSTRSINFANGSSARNYTFFSSEGTINADIEFSVINDDGSDIVGTNTLVVAQTGSASPITAGDGMVRISNAFNVVAADASLTINPDDMQVNIGNTNGDSLEVTATGLELVSTITGARRFEDALSLGTVAAGFTLPTTDGTNGQVMKTDGAGTVTWSDDEASKIKPQPEDVFTGDGATTIFTMTNAGTHATVKFLYVEVYYEGQLLFGTTGAVGTNDYGYDANTGQVTLASAPLNGDTLQIKHFSQDA